MISNGRFSETSPRNVSNNTDFWAPSLNSLVLAYVELVGTGGVVSYIRNLR